MEALAARSIHAALLRLPEGQHEVILLVGLEQFSCAHAAHLVNGLSRRVGTQLRAPDFGALGFELLGGCLLAGDSGPVAQFMVQNPRGRRVTLYVRRAVADNHETQFRHAIEGGVEVFYCIDPNAGYALSGQITHPDMQKLADVACLQLTGRQAAAN